MSTLAARAPGRPAASPSEKLRPLFEGLFRLALPQEPAFLAALAQAGVREGQAQSVRLFADGLEVARRHFFADRPPEAAHRRLGQLLIEGLSQTPAGRMATMTVPLLGPARLLGKLPPAYSLSGEALKVMSERLGQRTWQLEFRNEPRLPPEFAAGAAEELLRRCRVTPAVSVSRNSEAGGFDLRLCW
jgi:uncharacterized protein (TIGR02265 family)